MSHNKENPDKTQPGEQENSLDPAEMSLAELLGSSADTPAEEAPKRVDHRDDEPASGLVKLASMVEASGLQATKPESGFGVGEDSLPGEERTSTHPIVYSTVPPAHKSKTMPIFVALGVLAIVAIFAVSMLRSQNGDPSAANLEEIAKLRAQMMEQAKKTHQTADKGVVTVAAARQETVAVLEIPKPAAEKPVVTAKPEDTSPDKASVGQTAPDEARATKSASEKRAGRSSTRTKRSRNRHRSRPASTTSVTRPVAKASSPEPNAQGAAPSKTHELDALLGGSNKTRPVAQKSDTTTSGSKPGKPSKSEVKEAMTRVVAKAKSCSRFSTGTVQLQVTVGNNGRVKHSKALGSFANTTAGKCVEMMARTAKFSKFTESAFTFTYPVILR